MRFDELVVDEAQDCSEADLIILTLLHNGGLPLVLVGDPDQAIYEFRGSKPDAVQAFGSSLSGQLRLDSNWRSAPAICRLSWTLRPDRAVRPPDVAVGPQSNNPRPIVLLPFSGQSELAEAADRFLEFASSVGISAAESIILAHRGSVLPKDVVRLGRSPAISVSTAERLAWSKATLSSSIAGETREAAYAEAEAILMKYWVGTETTDEAPADTYARLELDVDDVRRAADGLIRGLPELSGASAEEWCVAANKGLKNWPPKSGYKRIGKSGSVRCPKAFKAKSASMLCKSASGHLSARVRGSVIHQVKGTELPAVLLVVPEDSRAELLISMWEAATAAEELRVLYVGITRAERFAAIAVPRHLTHRVTGILSNHEVPFTIGM
jgi:hypothetical protein